MTKLQLPSEAQLRQWDRPLPKANGIDPQRPDGGDWGEPADLQGSVASDPYPLKVFPEIARTAISDYQRYAKQPLALCGGSALAQMGLATQGLADVARDERLEGPISLNQLIIGDTGDRKSVADKQFGRASRAWKEEKCEQLLDEHRRSLALAKNHGAQVEGVKKRIASVAPKHRDTDRRELERLRERLVELEQNPVFVRPLPRLFFEDVNSASLQYDLAVGWPSAGLYSDEAGAFIGSQGMATETAMALLALLNILWDGRSYLPTRKVAKVAELVGRRFGVFLMMQPSLLKDLVDKGARNHGFLSRFLLSAQKSTKGTRFYSEPPDSRSQEAFDRRIWDLLEMDLPVDRSSNDRGPLMRLKPPVMHMDPRAKALWVEFHDSVERKLGPFGEFSLVADVASKTPENAVRIAAVFQLFDQGEFAPRLERIYVEAGIALASWHLHEALRIFFEADTPEAVDDARLLSEWPSTDARHILGQDGRPILDGNRIPAQKILQYGPYRLRERDRRDRALEILAEDDVRHAILVAKHRRKEVWVNPILLSLQT